MKPPVPITAFDLNTKRRIDFPSMSTARNYCKVDISTIQKYLHNDQMFRGWYWCLTAEADSKTERMEYLARRWKAAKPLQPRKAKTLVSLRIDAHTCILVPREKATPEYAEKYRQKLSKNLNY